MGSVLIMQRWEERDSGQGGPGELRRKDKDSLVTRTGWLVIGVLEGNAENVARVHTGEGSSTHEEFNLIL